MLHCREEFPFHQSCEKCQNFENVIDEISKCMTGIPKRYRQNVSSPVCVLTMVIFLTLFVFYVIVMIVEHRRVKLVFNKEMFAKLTETRKNSLSMEWENKSPTKESVAQTYLHWNFHRISYSGLLNMYIIQL